MTQLLAPSAGIAPDAQSCGPLDVVAESRSRLMLVTNYSGRGSASGGRELLCKVNHDALKDVYGDALIVYSIQARQKHGWRTVTEAFRGFIDGVNADSMHAILQEIEGCNVRKLFLDGSNLGGLARAVRARFPGLEVITFFHNVEARFFLGSLRHKASARAVGVLLANYLAERQAVRCSQKRIALSQRDSTLMARIYGRRATHVCPLAVQEDAGGKPAHGDIEPGNFALFVGGAFYANVDGITWFVDEVVSRTGQMTYVIGRGFEKYKSRLEAKGSVRVLGAVESLDEWYAKALFVVAPIFDGSGMKTKVAEALMYGKKVIGTPEAFSGYEDVAAEAGWICRSADEFVAAVGEARATIAQPFEERLRKLYMETYSYEAARRRLAACVGPLE